MSATAVIISGQLRSFARCYPTQCWQIFRHYEPDIHFFVSCVDDENAASAELLRQHYQNVHIEKFTDPTDLPEVPIEYGAYAPYANATSHHKLMLQHWSNKLAWEFFLKELAMVDYKNGVTHFETFIRMRPDNFFHRCQPPKLRVLDGEITGGGFVTPRMDDTCHTPWWGKFGGINDRFAIMGYKAAEAYFTTYDRIPELLAMGCPFHPESLVAASLRAAGVTSKTDLMASFSTMRVNGEQRWPEITNEDIAELIASR